eukprot:1194123-Prorocentrum_minimum.AAC.2
MPLASKSLLFPHEFKFAIDSSRMSHVRVELDLEVTNDSTPPIGVRSIRYTSSGHMNFPDCESGEQWA